MRAYIVKRLLLAIPTVLGAVTVVFIAMQLAPGDPAALFIPPDIPSDAREEMYAEIQRIYGFDQPMHVQYFAYVRRVATLDFGRSIRQNTDVIEDLRRRIPHTLQLGITALLISTSLGITAGVVSAIYRGSWVDGWTRFGALFGVSMPDFWLSLMLILLLALYIPIFPPSGYGGPIYTVEGLRHLALPAIVLGLSGAGGIARYTRSSMLEVINEDYVRTARAKGLGEYAVIARHGLRNALIPVVTILGLSFGYILSGTVIVETVFGWPGIGRYLISGINGRDFPVVQGTVIVIATGFVLVNLITDILLVYIDPRIRYDA
jgi:ABC-type dipeptide/oligopeptide/nickel transport system permease component